MTSQRESVRKPPGDRALSGVTAERQAGPESHRFLQHSGWLCHIVAGVYAPLLPEDPKRKGPEASSEGYATSPPRLGVLNGAIWSLAERGQKKSLIPASASTTVLPVKNTSLLGNGGLNLLASQRQDPSSANFPLASIETRNLVQSTLL